MKANSFNKWEKPLLWTGFTLFVVFTFVSTWTHEPWIDEIYAWQISKFSIPAIFYEMRYEGHFALWSLLLSPFSHMGLPLKTLGIISWALNAVAIGYFLWKSPFRWWAKLVLLVAVPFLYINPAVSRCYVLIPLLIFPLAHYYPYTLGKYGRDQVNKGYWTCGILLAFLSNTHVYIEGFVGVMSLLLFLQIVHDWKMLTGNQKKQRIFSLCLIVVAVLVAFLQVYPSLNNSKVFTGSESFGAHPIVFLRSSSIGTPKRMATALLLLLISIIYFFKRRIAIAFVFVLSCLYMVLICIYIYSAGVPGRAVMWFYYLLFAFWVVGSLPHKEGNWQSAFNKFFPSTAIVLFSLLMCHPNQNIHDMKHLYSGESRFAYFIRDNVSEDAPIYSNPNAWCCVEMEYLPTYHFFNIKDGTSLYPRKDRLPIDSLQAERYLQQAFLAHPCDDYIYLMDCVKKTSPANYIERYHVPYEYEILYPATDEQQSYYLQYYLLKVKRPKGNEDERMKLFL